MKQKQAELALNKEDDIKQRFEEIKNTQTHRTVRLQYRSCCGCGCSDVTLLRTVPFDSPLKDGDRVKNPEKGDGWE